MKPTIKPKQAMITLKDTFNNHVISRHRTVAAAVRARAAHDKAVKRANGQSSYLTYSITADDGRDLSDEIGRAECERHDKHFNR